MKALIALLTAATGILHLLVGFDVMGGFNLINWILVLNGVGYLVLLWLFWTSSGSRRGTIRWILLAYTLITLVGYFVINGSAGFQSAMGLIIKGIELLLIILLFLDRGSDRVAVTAPAPAATRTGAVVSSEAYQAASGIGAASSAAAIGAAATLDRTEAAADASARSAIADTSDWGEATAAEVDATMARATADVPVWSEPATDLGLSGSTATLDTNYVGADYEVVEEVEDAVDEAEDVVEDAGEGISDWVDPAGDAASGAWAATGAALAGAGAWLGDKAEDAVDTTDDALDAAGDRVGDAVDATGDALSDAGDWVGDKAEDAVDATGDAVLDAGTQSSVAAGGAVEWVGDTAQTSDDALLDAERSVAAGGAAEWVGDAAETTGDALAMGSVAAGGAAEWVGDTAQTSGDALLDAERSVAAGGAAEWVGDAAETTGEPTADQLRSELEEYLRSFGSGSEFRKGVEYIEGIGPAKGAKLRGVGIITVLDLMVEGATRRGRKNISDRSGLTVSEVLTWVNHVDLFRIKGVAEEYADLLEQSGVDTVVELAQRNPNNLFKRMNDINQEKQLVRRTPHLSEVQSWVEQAKNLKRLIHY
jgi:ElaB/YqjD/DUF883 family membrane-anchored ribosome-binding protein